MKRFDLLRPSAIGIAAILLLAPAGSAQTVDGEPNDTFESRETLPSDTTTITSELTQRFDPTSFDHSFSGNLSPGEAIPFDLEDLPPSEPFYAWIDNGTNGPDTIIGVFNETSTLIGSDDDGSPVGNGVASGIGGTVNADGTVHLAVTGFPDFEFQGLKAGSPLVHEQSGAYEVHVKMGIEAPQGDVDYYSITDLTPGAAFTIEVANASFDSILVWLDDAGTVVTVDDDGGTELLSKIRGFVPLSGSINFAISTFGDLEFTGRHIESGAYTLSVDITEE